MSIQIDMPLADSDAMFGWIILDPCRLLAESVACSLRLQSVIAKALREHPCSMERQWKIVIAFDEFASGNKMKVGNARKSMVLSYSFTASNFNRTPLQTDCENRWRMASLLAELRATPLLLGIGDIDSRHPSFLFNLTANLSQAVLHIGEACNDPDTKQTLATRVKPRPNKGCIV